MIVDIIDSEGLKHFHLIFLSIFSCFSRAFLDTIEKYLFEVDFINPYAVLIIKGIFGTLLTPILFITSKIPYQDIHDIKEISSDEEEKMAFFFNNFINFIFNF